MQLSGLRQPLDGADLGALRLHRQHDAGPRGLAVEQDRAGAADAVLAARVGPGKAEILAEEVDQQLARLGAPSVHLAVDRQADVDEIGHQRILPLPAAARRTARPASTRVRCRRNSADPFWSVIGSTEPAATVAASSTAAPPRPLLSRMASAARNRSGTGPVPAVARRAVT